MKKEIKLKYINELLKSFNGITNYSHPKIKYFIKDAKVKISAIDKPDSRFIEEIDIFKNNTRNQIIIDDWKEQIFHVLHHLRFKIENEWEEVTSNFKTTKIHCNKCNHSTTHNIIFECKDRIISTELVDGRYIDFWTDENLHILKCNNCTEVAMKKFEIWCDDAPDFPQLDVIVYPRRDNPLFKKSESFKNVPEQILSLYEEIIEAFLNNVNLLCAGGIRAILEAICIDKKIKGGNVSENQIQVYRDSMKGKINGLHELGVLSKNHADILHHHQYIGNKALHELQRPSTDELEIAIEIIADTLNSIYEVGVKGKELKNRKENRNSKSN